MEKVYILDKETNIAYYLIGVSSISPNQQVTVTEYPVPEGSFISDHAYKNSDSLSLKVMFDALDNTHQSYYVNFDGTSGILTYDMFKDVLQKWVTQATQLEIQTVHHLFRSMVLSGLSWSEGSKRTKFEPTLSFTEIRVGHLYVLPLSTLGVQYSASYAPAEISSGTYNGEEMPGKSTGEIIGNIGGYAAGGAVIGGIFGPAGALVGGAVGAAIGFFNNLDNIF